MTEWKTYRLGDICDLVAGFAFKSKDFGAYPNKVVKIADIQPPVVNTNDLAGVDMSSYSTNKLCKYIVTKDDYVLAMTGATIGKLGRIINDIEAYINQRVLTFRPNKSIVDKDYLYYQLCSANFSKYILNHIDSETAQPNISAGSVGGFEITLPGLEEQRRIAGMLGAIDDKIENNRRINDNLELQAQALFDEWFVNDSTQPAEYNRASLTDIANYLNGLAMQRFPPQSDEKAIPVLKIKELGQGMCDSSSDICSQSIDSKYIVNDGDIIFSWSGTLLVDIWCGGICGLNQHLFKVTSDKYPKWFVYYWTKYHLAKFIRIAKDKAVTMGHIKRGDLETSEVLIPNAEILSKMDNIIAPIFDAIISRRVENKTLATLRDTLLPKLMNGEIKL